MTATETLFALTLLAVPAIIIAVLDWPRKMAEQAVEAVLAWI